MSADAVSLFDEANRLWFGEGASTRALALYEQAARAAPDDPVLAFQLARACWALGRQDDALTALAAAEARIDELSPLGRSILVRARPRLAAPPPSDPPGIPAASLDLDVLLPLGLSPERWLEVARAARDREMYGLAAEALARGSTFVVLELERDEYELRGAASAAVDMLRSMYAGPAPVSPLLPQAHDEDPVVPTAPPPRRERVTASRPLVAPALEIDIAPRVSAIGEPLVLAVRLVNPTDAPLTVNGRLLLSRANTPPGYGELALAVEGPSEYANATRFTIRTRRAGPEDLVTLEPGEAIERSYPLATYESLHLPGTYRIWVTYRTEVDGGAFVGAVSSEAVSIERRA